MNRARLPLVVGIVLLSACGRSGDPEQRFQSWLATPQAARVADYRDHLRRAGVADVLPMESLLHSGRRWRRCGAAEFIVPPESDWPNIVPTISAARQLQSLGFLDGARVASAYRDPGFNHCEGGSSRSRHLTNNALDFDLARADPGDMKRLCAWWRQQGAELRLGLGFYDADKIHIDTSGFRTWGYDYTRKTSLCA